MTTLYRKHGRRYHPVAEFDTFDAWPEGAHLVVCKPGSRVTRFRINPDRAPIAAAAEPIRDAVRDLVAQKLAMRPARPPVTPAQHAAWRRFVRVMGNDGYVVEYPSVSEIADAVADLVIEHARQPLSDN